MPKLLDRSKKAYELDDIKSGVYCIKEEDQHDVEESVVLAQEN